MQLFKHCALVWVSMLFAFPVSAETGIAGSAENKVVIDPTSSTYLLQMLAALVGIILLIFVLAWMFKKLQLTRTGGQGLIRIVSVLPVGTRDRIALLQVGEEQILVSLSPGKIEKLHALQQPVDVEESQQPSETLPHRFQSLMQAAQKRTTS